MKKEAVKPWSQAYTNNRIELSKCIPLKIPLCICIEPTNICNFKCRMCWQGTEEYEQFGGPFCNLDMNLFAHILENIAFMCKKYGEKIKLIKLYSTGEPMLNKDLGKMIKLIKKANVCYQLEVTSNCGMLTKDLADDMIEAGLDYLRISVYSVLSERHSYVTRQTKITPEIIHQQVAYLYDKRNKLGKEKPFICAKIIDTNSSENELFKEYYKDVSDEQIIDTPWNLAKLKENSLDALYGDAGSAMHEKYEEMSIYKRRKACRYPFTHMTIRSNGDVVVCCVDWSRDTLLGNLHNESLDDIWNGKRLYDFRVMQLKTHGEKHPLCSSCEVPLRDMSEDNVDNVKIEKLSYKGKENDF